MSNANLGLTDLIKLNDQNARDLGVTDILNMAPFLRVLNATTASNGTQHHYIKQTGAPTVGFRAVNTGKDNSVSAYTEVDITLKNLDASFFVDTQVAKNYRGGSQAFIAREAGNQLQQAFFSFEQQVFYGTGTGGNAAGFAGLADNSLFSGLTGNSATIVNAAGTTAATASSIWLIRTTPDEKNMTAVIGNAGQISIGETVLTAKADDTTPSKTYPVYFTEIDAYCALQIGSAYSAVRIGNVTADSGKGATDILISKGISLFPAYAPPTHIVMNRRSLQQLQQSRTVYNPMGKPAEFPQDVFGIPIVVTDAILSTEALLT